MAEDAGTWTRDSIEKWICATLEWEYAELRVLTGGNSRFVAITSPGEAGDGRQWLVRANLRHDPSDPFPLEHEARVYAALARTDVLAPALCAVSADTAVLMTAVVPGLTDLRPLPPVRLRALTRDLLRVLDELHAVPLEQLAEDGFLLGEPVPSSMEAAVGAELGRWCAAVRAAMSPPDPLIELGLRWLLDNVPAVASPAVLVHGDLGPDNFLYEGEAVTGLIDWELAHPGDPLEDLCWLLMRTALADLPEMTDEVVAQLKERGAFASERARHDYQLVLVLWKLLVIRHRAVGDAGRNLGRDIYYRLQHRRMFVEAMSRALGVAEPEVSSAEWRTTERSWLFDAAIEQVKETALPAIEEDADRVRLSGLVRVLRYLRAWDGIDDREHKEAGAELLAGQIRACDVSVSDAYPGLARRVLAEYALCSDLLGGMREITLFASEGDAD
jgi:aminoglycoside phosphotransferase (APT) family kinase protein